MTTTHADALVNWIDTVIESGCGYGLGDKDLLTQAKVIDSSVTTVGAKDSFGSRYLEYKFSDGSSVSYLCVE
jgi:putative NADPH-quinone reductase